MAYPADRIIQVNARISPAGLGFANFASATLFADSTEIGALTKDTYKTYFDITEVAADYADTTDTYKAAAKWLGGTPKMRQINIWVTDPADATLTATLNKARDSFWWYWTLFTADTYAAEAEVLLAAAWCEENASMFVDNQTGTAVTAIRDQNETGDIATKLTTLGYRHAYTAAHATDAYAGTALAKHFAAVNYSGENSTITGEFKKSPGVASEDLKGSEIAAMEADTKKATFYATVELQGSSDVGRWLNTITHSTYGEYIDDVVNLDAFINTLTVSTYNTIANVPTKLRQTPRGQAVILASVDDDCQKFITNGYMGPRIYTDPDDGIEKYTVGYEILTKPEDILVISDEDRNIRLSAPIRVRIFRAGAIHKSIIDLSVF
ncbi:MAG TPA: DUF3383 family protein [Methylophaga aminisulfidivorans]|uniref:DUF3383 family protein n=2 Tax=root TaxID=1 RepID=A0A7C2AMV6_9GAMM|nr:DUF3383 family protein [Methylophaga aminisulfidivorans]